MNGVRMRIVNGLAFLSLLSVTALGQTNPKRIFLSPKSNITTAEIAEGFAKSCPNVTLTQDAGEADYVLEATTYRLWRFTPTHERGTWDIVLMMNAGGDGLMAPHPEVHRQKYKHHFEAICKFVNESPSPQPK